MNTSRFSSSVLILTETDLQISVTQTGAKKSHSKQTQQRQQQHQTGQQWMTNQQARRFAGTVVWWEKLGEGSVGQDGYKNVIRRQHV